MYSPGSSALVEKQLTQILNIRQLNARQLLSLQKTLLFIKAYPQCNNHIELANKVIGHCEKLLKGCSSGKKKELEQSALPYTFTSGYYSYSLLNWLRTLKSGEMEWLDSDSAGLHPRDVMKHALSEMEFDLIGQDSMSAEEWLAHASGSNEKNTWLDFTFTQLDGLYCSRSLKDQLFEALHIGIRFKALDQSMSMFSMALSHGPVYEHSDGMLKRFDENELMRRPLPRSSALSLKEKNELLKKARLCLFLLNRETDPVSQGYTNGLEYYELERGFSLAFFSSLPEHRLPLESYIGFMMFKNRQPIAYGGAWLFGERSLLGINIFEAFRGGESAFLFCQLLRGYKQRFKLQYIEVEPYQFGLGNPEGIKSGAFWFYYRFGFRPVDPQLAKQAEQEWRQIQKNKAYRSTYATLKSYTASNLALRFDTVFHNLDPGIISRFITQHITLRHHSNRKSFRTWCIQKIKSELGDHYFSKAKNLHTGLEKLYPFLALCLDLRRMNGQEKKLLLDMIAEKGGSEFRYAELLCDLNLQKHLAPAELRKQLGI